ncbi:SseB family protein [Microbacterium sp. NPDC078428]|uniref:SseB family protein n=1 Tax=Microbacterium sp. NPDC078428 TaxID=3364190 RepID=UPI0037CA97E0
MALFSRRPKATDAAASADGAIPAQPDESPAPGGSAVEGGPQGGAQDTAAEPAPQVNISVSTFRGVGAVRPPEASEARLTQQASGADPIAPAAPPRRSAPAEAPPARESVPGMKDNVLLVQALSELDEPVTAPQLLEVARQLLQGHVFLRIRGDARALLAEGKELPLAVAKRGDDQFVLAYSSGSALQDAVRADGQTDTSAVPQPALAVVKHVVAGPYAGLLIDGASAPARAILPRTVLEPALTQADEAMRVKTLLAAPRTPEVAASLAEALAETPVWVAVRNTAPEGETPRMGIAEARTADGRRLLEVYSHPLEIVAMGRGDRPLPFPPAQLGKALRDHPEMAGVIVDPAGPWLALDRDVLAPVLALPEPAAAAAASGTTGPGRPEPGGAKAE